MLPCARQVYGCQPQWRKLLKQLAGRRTEEKFDEVVRQLTALTAQVWELQEGSQGGSTSRCAARVYVGLRPVTKGFCRVATRGHGGCPSQTWVLVTHGLGGCGP